MTVSPAAYGRTRVFLFSSGTLFGGGMESLLRQESGLELVGCETDVSRALDQIRHLAPEVIVFEDGEAAAEARRVLMGVLGDSPRTRLIGLNPHDSTICVYRSDEQAVKDVGDLTAVIKVRRSAETMEPAEQRLLDLASKVSGYRIAVYTILKLCETPRLYSEVEAAVLPLPQMKNAVYSPGNLLTWLEERGGIERLAEEGRWQTTQAGRKVAEAEAPDKRLLQLISHDPAYSEIYLQVLGYCQTPRKRTEVEDLLKRNPAMVKPKVYASFFTGGLEDVGGLEWVDGLWRTTEAGRTVLG